MLGKCLRKIQDISLYRKFASPARHGVEISDACEEDMGKVQECFDLDVEIPFSNYSNAVNFVAKKREKIIGFAQLVRHSEGGTLDNGHWLFSLNVRLLYRGLGIGEELIRKVIRRARDEGASELSLLIYDDNHSALRLYHKLGFRTKNIEAIDEKIEKERAAGNRKKLILARTLVE